MDNNIQTVIIINLIINVLMIFNKFLSRIKKSKCLGNEIELTSDNNNKDNKNNTIDFNQFLNILQQNINNDNNKKENNEKKDEVLNKL